MGKMRPTINVVAAKVFAKGPGASLTDMTNMSTTARNRYWASYMDHGWVRRARRVSRGSKEVSSEEMDEVGDCLLRMRERVALHLRRKRCGTKLGSEDSPGIVLEPWSMSEVEWSRKAR